MRYFWYYFKKNFMCIFGIWFNSINDAWVYSATIELMVFIFILLKCVLKQSYCVLWLLCCFPFEYLILIVVFIKTIVDCFKPIENWYTKYLSLKE